MSNQTIAQLPYDLTDVTSLKRFLRELVDNLDIVLGYKGDSEGYVSTKEQAQTLFNIRESLIELRDTADANTKSLDELKTDLEELISQVDSQNTTAVKPALGSDYYDFNSTAWDNLAGSYTLSADGADLLNTPFAATGGTVYDVFISAVDTGSDAHHDITVGKATPSVYTRWGVAGDWIQLG